MKTTLLDHLSLLCLTLAAAGCGGGGSSSSSVQPPDDVKAAAATQTVQQNSNCTALTPFYWEIGNATGKLASGTSAPGAPGQNEVLPIASASKWLYGAYVVEKRGAAGLSAQTDVPFLNFTSGYSNFGLPTCPSVGGSINDCLNSDNPLTGDPRGTLSPEDVGKFAYDSGHMQKHASNLGLGGFDATMLGQEVSSTLGISVGYSDAQPAASGRASAAEYAKFLRKILGGSLRIRSVLGAHKVCTWHDDASCSAVSSPTDSTSFHWHYSLGHWVEDDDANQAFSSAGAFGFYPWVSADLKLYGLIVRSETLSGEQQGFQSAKCGRLVRLAYQTGVAQ